MDRERGVRYIDPMVQVFHAAFAVGERGGRIHMVDANGVNLAWIQALDRKLLEKTKGSSGLKTTCQR